MKEKLFNLIWVLVILIASAPFELCAQEDELRCYLSEYNLELLTIPNNFSLEADDGQLYMRDGKTIVYGFKYNLYSPKRDIVLCFAPLPKPKANRNLDLKTRQFRALNTNFIHPNYPVTEKDFRYENLWKLLIEFNRDTLQFSPVSFSMKYEKLSNSDTIVVFPLDIANGFGYKKDFTKCLVTVFQNHNIGSCCLYYFYKDGIEPEKILCEIKDMWGFVKFKNFDGK